MPATATRNQGKTLFVKETLIDHPTANPKFVNEAWERAGMEGTISDTLVNKMRAQLKLTGNLRGNGAAKRRKGAVSKRSSAGRKRRAKDVTVARSDGVTGEVRPRTSGRSSVRLAELEAEIDRLLFSVMSLGNLPEVEDALRQTRRALYRAFATKH